MRERRSGDRAAGGRRRGSRLAVALLLVAGGALAAAAFAVFGSGDREPFLPQNDSLWSSPVAPREEDAGPDSPAGRDTDDADAAEAGAGGRP